MATGATKDGTLSVEEFCEGTAKVRGTAQSLDIVQLTHETGKLRDSVWVLEYYSFIFFFWFWVPDIDTSA